MEQVEQAIEDWRRPAPRDAQPAIAGFTLTAKHGVDVAWQAVRPGTVQLPASSEHRIRVYAGGPIASVCSSGERFVSQAGELDLMPAGYADSWREESEGASLWLGLSPRLLHRAAEDLGLDHSRGLDLQHQFRDPRIEHIAWALEDERRSGYENGALYRESLGLALSVHLLRRYAAPRPIQGGLSPARLRRLTEYIDAHLAQELSLGELASIAGVSATHLKAQFRQSTGQPVHQYVMRQRVDRARHLLEETELSISQIALDTGFAHQSHLARCMRRLLGTTPSGVRRTFAE
ncbi:MAG TPA: AraC family transcriptional regulator [Polyangiales bacterium]